MPRDFRLYNNMHWWINIGDNQGRQCVFLSFGRFPPSGCLAVVWSAASQRPPPHTSQLSSRLSLGVCRWWATLQNAVSLFSQRVTFTSWLESGNIVFGVKITTCFSCRCAEVSLKTRFVATNTWRYQVVSPLQMLKQSPPPLTGKSFTLYQVFSEM